MSYEYTAKVLSQVGAGQELATKQDMKEPPNPDRVKAAAQFLLCHTSSSSFLSSAFLLSPISRGSELSMCGSPCTRMRVFAAEMILSGPLSSLGAPSTWDCQSLPNMHCCPRWSRTQQRPGVFWHLEEVRLPVPSSGYTPGVIAHRPMT